MYRLMNILIPRFSSFFYCFRFFFSRKVWGDGGFVFTEFGGEDALWMRRV